MPEPKILTAEQLQIIDEDGVVRIALGTSKSEHMPYVNLYDRSGAARLAISLDHDEAPHITLFSSDGTGALGLGVSISDGEEEAGITMVSVGGRVLVNFSVVPDGFIQEVISAHKEKGKKTKRKKKQA